MCICNNSSEKDCNLPRKEAESKSNDFIETTATSAPHCIKPFRMPVRGGEHHLRPTNLHSGLQPNRWHDSTHCLLKSSYFTQKTVLCRHLVSSATIRTPHGDLPLTTTQDRCNRPLAGARRRYVLSTRHATSTAFDCAGADNCKRIRWQTTRHTSPPSVRSTRSPCPTSHRLSTIRLKTKRMRQISVSCALR